MKKKINVDIKVEKNIAERINRLLEIEDFKEDETILEKLEFDVYSTVYSTVYSKSLLVDYYDIQLKVCTGQTNAWIDFIVTEEEEESPVECEPSFEPLEGKYIAELNRHI